MRGRRGAAVVVAAVVAAVAGAAGCTAETSWGDGRELPAAADGGPAPSGPAAGREPSAGQELPAGQEPVPEQEPAEALEHRGDASLAYPSGRAGDALTLTLSCRGDGTVEVRVPRVGTTVPSRCHDGKVTGYEHRIGVEGAERAGTAVVTAPPEVEWTLTVTRTVPATSP
ncbi:hypothetical protein ABT026_26635 [Streptomyces sp. NPDC002734]|uniref:hypothetical protein n=1 Tax=Streptomyces sp. NPDC002734 TaxID=3154426 RepID=UPI00332CE0BF